MGSVEFCWEGFANIKEGLRIFLLSKQADVEVTPGKGIWVTEGRVGLEERVAKMISSLLNLVIFYMAATD